MGKTIVTDPDALKELQFPETVTCQVLGYMEKKDNEIILIGRVRFRNEMRVDIRLYYTQNGILWLPTSKGISILEELYDELSIMIAEVGGWLLEN
jgi:hypothetical protein